MPDKLHEQYREGAAKCRVDGVPIDGEPGGAIHQWVLDHCTFRPGTEFFIVLGICAEMADMEAQSEGYANQSDRALSGIPWRKRK